MAIGCGGVGATQGDLAQDLLRILLKRLSPHCSRYRMPTYTTTRQANIRATGSLGFASGARAGCRWTGLRLAGGRLKAVTVPFVRSFERAGRAGGAPAPPISP